MVKAKPSMITEDEVRTALDKVIHPSFGMSLVTLGMVHAVRVIPDGVEVDLVMNCPGCPGAEIALALARRELLALNGVSTVTFKLLPKAWTPPWAGLTTGEWG